mgnify:CR=1 FL=1
MFSSPPSVENRHGYYGTMGRVGQIGVCAYPRTCQFDDCTQAILFTYVIICKEYHIVYVDKVKDSQKYFLELSK